MVDGEDEAAVLGRRGPKYRLRALDTGFVYEGWWHQLRLLRGRLSWLRLDPAEFDDPQT